MSKNRKILAAFLAIALVVAFVTPTSKANAAEKYTVSYALQDSDTTIANGTYAMDIGAKADFKFTGAPDNWKDLFKGWKSSNTAVATVNSNGVVTAKSQGTAYITADLGSSCTGSLKIQVGGEVTLGTLNCIDLDYYYLDKAGAEIDLNFYGVLDWFDVYKGAKCTWTSSNEKVAVVDKKGVVTSVSSGTAEIGLRIKFANGAVIEAKSCSIIVR
ncbi:MAG: Ig-like domain-containing protein [Lachnospiraceae bacterium]|nr:Ig-like domain-containing protein [Lachnospiraceae bacterium]